MGLRRMGGGICPRGIEGFEDMGVWCRDVIRRLRNSSWSLVGAGRKSGCCRNYRREKGSPEIGMHRGKAIAQSSVLRKYTLDRLEAMWVI